MRAAHTVILFYNYSLWHVTIIIISPLFKEIIPNCCRYRNRWIEVYSTIDLSWHCTFVTILISSSWLFSSCECMDIKECIFIQIRLRFWNCSLRMREDNLNLQTWWLIMLELTYIHDSMYDNLGRNRHSKNFVQAFAKWCKARTTKFELMMLRYNSLFIQD